MSLQKTIQELLRQLGDDPLREGLIDTPKRVTKAWKELTYRGDESVESIVGSGVFTVDQSQDAGIVTVRDIPFSSISAETLLPFQGQVHVAYSIVNGKILGLSKAPRLVSVFSRGICGQQQLTDSVAEAIVKATGSEQVAVTINATHVFYDKPIEVQTTLRICTQSQDAVEELMAVLPMNREGVRSYPVSKSCPCKNGYTRDSFQSSGMPKTMRVLFKKLNIGSIENSAIEEYGNQLFHATIGSRLPDQCSSPSLTSPQKLSCDANGSLSQVTCVFDFQSLCEHHILPFYGKLFLGCSDNKTNLDGLDLESIISNSLMYVSRRLQVQERLMNQIANEVISLLPSASVVVICDALHSCMIARGIRSHGCSTRTLCTRGKCSSSFLALGNAMLDKELRSDYK